MLMLSDLIISRVRVKILQLFFSSPVKIIHVREIVRRTDEEINAVRRELAHLEKAPGKYRQPALDLTDAVLVSLALWNIGPPSEIAITPAAIGQKSDLRRQITEAGGIIQGKILQLVRTDDVFGPLARLRVVVVIGNEFGTEIGLDDG